MSCRLVRGSLGFSMNPDAGGESQQAGGTWKLVSYFMNLQSQASTNMAGLLLEDRYFRLEPEIESWGLDDTRHLGALKALADRHFTENSEEITKKMRRIRPD